MTATSTQRGRGLNRRAEEALRSQGDAGWVANNLGSLTLNQSGPATRLIYFQEKEDHSVATLAPIIAIEDRGQDLAQKTVCLKVHLGLVGNSRKGSNSQVEVDADKHLIRVSKTLLDSVELQAIKTLDGEVRRYLYDNCLPFESGIQLVPLPQIETVDQKLREYALKRLELVEAFVGAYPRLCEQAAARLRTLHTPNDYPS